MKKFNAKKVANSVITAQNKVESFNNKFEEGKYKPFAKLAKDLRIKSQELDIPTALGAAEAFYDSEMLELSNIYGNSPLLDKVKAYLNKEYQNYLSDIKRLETFYLPKVEKTNKNQKVTA